MGKLRMPNRAVMVPMTRGRATGEGVPTPIMAEYYGLRAEAGLLITEATAISRQGSGWLNAPGIYTETQVAAWRPITERVHAAGGRIFLQLWHMGRVSHPDFLDGALPVGPSAVAAAGETHTPTGKQSYVVPRALDAGELPGIVDDYRKATENALRAGFDGVEIHAANGYLLDQFLRDGSNRRSDEFGGSIENRLRFPLAVAKAVADVAGAGRTGIRISPQGQYNDMKDSNPLALFSAFTKALNGTGVTYLHVMDPVTADHMLSNGEPQMHPALRPLFPGTLMVNGGYTRETAEAALAQGTADLIAFGVPYLANPDLLERLRAGAAMNAPDFATLYSPGVKGYLDYPVLNANATP
ncbi:MAG: alkene reductase [Bryobacteraceae bacterium]|nr:alkene reductase [Bryobacteraceae bacterium]